MWLPNFHQCGLHLIFIDVKHDLIHVGSETVSGATVYIYYFFFSLLPFNIVLN